jgi:predicted nucleic-acid-binding protein
VEERKFSKKQALKFGWETVTGNIGFFIGLSLVVFVVVYVPAFVSSVTEKTYPVISFIFSLISNILSMIVGMGFIKIALKFYDKQKADFDDLFSCAKQFFPYLLSAILMTLAVIGGIIVLIVPGIILGLQLQFFAYFIVDKKTGPMQALKESSRITRGQKWQLFLFALLTVLVNIAGLLCLVVGLLVTIPLTSLAYAYIYRKLEQGEVAHV